MDVLLKSNVLNTTKPLTRSKKIILIGAIDAYGTVITDIYEGGTTQKCFTNFLTILHENMRNDDIIIMDNMKSHHAKSVIIFMNENNINFMFLPHTVQILTQLNTTNHIKFRKSRPTNKDNHFICN